MKQVKKTLLLASLLAIVTLPNSFSAGGVTGDIEIKIPTSSPLLTSYEIWDSSQRLNSTHVTTDDLGAIITDTHIQFSKPGMYTVHAEIDGIETSKEVTVGRPEIYLDLPFNGYKVNYVNGSSSLTSSGRILLNEVESIDAVTESSKAKILAVTEEGELQLSEGLKIDKSIITLEGGQ